MEPRYHWSPQGYADPNANTHYYPQQGAPPQQQMYMQMGGSYPAQQSSGYGIPAPMQYSSPMLPQQQQQQQQYTPQHTPQHQYSHPYSYPPTQTVQPQVQRQPPQQQYPQPRVMIPPPQTLAQTLAQQQYTAPHPQPQPQIQPRQLQPQVVIPQKSTSLYNPSPLAGMQNPRIRQVQVQVPAHSQGQRRDTEVGGGQTRPPQVQRSNSGAGIRGGGGQEAQVRPLQSQPSPATPRPVQRTPSFQQDAMYARAPPLRSPAADSKPSPQVQQQKHSTPQFQRPAHPPSSAPQHRSSGLPQTPSSQQRMAHPKVVIKSSTPQSAPSQTRPPHPSPKALPTDLAVLLLQAADEYIDAARSIGTVAALIKNQKDLAQYYKLMATALGCMESVLKNFTLLPREQASLMLRYASLLVEETNNNEEIESVLSKGIALCARSRLLDIKYSMQHLEARYQFKTNHRAALKSLDGHISDAETFQHIVWVYAFRFLKVSLALRVRGRPETVSALQQLHEISKQADKRGDRAISITASALEAMVHLRAGGPDHLEHAQRAIAAARTYQLQETSKELGQISALIDAVDVACGLQKGQPDWQKMNALQQKADRQPGPDDGVFSVLIEKSFGGQNLTQCTGGVFKKAQDGRDELVLSWLPKNSLNMLAYHLSGLACSVTEVSRGRAYLKEGQRIAQDALQRPLRCPMSVPASVRQLEWIKILDWHLAFSLGIMACRAEDFTQATQALDYLRKRIALSPFKDDDSYIIYTSYLSAILSQCTGSFTEAATTYSLPLFSLPNPGTPQDIKTTLSILANLNHLLLLRSNPAQQWQTDLLTSQLEPLLTAHPNVQLETAFRLLLALTKNTDAISVNRQKTLLSNASTKAQQLHNYQLITICLCYVSERFFSEAVGEQAVKSVRAARNVARKEGRGVLWRAVACGLCERVFERNGLAEDAAEVRKVWSEEVAAGLPDKMKVMLRGDGNGQAMLEGGEGRMVVVE